MSQLKGWQRKLVLTFKSEKRLGAATILKTFTKKTIEEMKATLITKDMCDPAALTDKPKSLDLSAHLDNLKHQFIGQPEINFYHATLIVLLRRGYKVTETFCEFEALWTTETDYLLEHFSLRWIISACDTFVDHSPDQTRKAILMNASTLINTSKVHESQQFLYKDNLPKAVNLKQKQKFVEGDQPLYDGLTYFRIGNDDTLCNMRKRYKKFCQLDAFAGRMLLHIFDRLQYLDSAFALAKSLHGDTSTWWENP